jgi:hypothetical protein
MELFVAGHGSGGGYLAKLTEEGILTWFTHPGFYGFYAISGNNTDIYLSGEIAANNPLAAGLDTNGAVNWSISGFSDGTNTGITSDPDGSVYFIGYNNDIDFYIGKVGPANSPPIANAGGPYVVDEGNSVTLNASASTDPDNNIISYEWDLDYDGLYDDALGVSVEVSYPDGPSAPPVGVKVTDSYGESDTATTTVTVNNIAPTIENVSIPTEPININEQSSYQINVAYSDPGGTFDESYTCDFDMNYDGIIDATTQVAGTSCSTPLTYSEPGVYTVEVIVSDKDGGSDSFITTGFIVIYDPEGGFVTGGGWFISPEGAYSPNPSLTGKASFGFVSKYKKGATIPIGNTEFHFKAGELNFHSSDYEWLVVTGSDYARFKGTGTINGEGEYKFMIWAGDGEHDTFRIKIWEEVDNIETVIYDNGMDQPIEDGNVVVHTK